MSNKLRYFENISRTIEQLIVEFENKKRIDFDIESFLIELKEFRMYIANSVNGEFKGKLLELVEIADSNISEFFNIHPEKPFWTMYRLVNPILIYFRNLFIKDYRKIIVSSLREIKLIIEEELIIE